jgi:hypothetical protein
MLSFIMLSVIMLEVVLQNIIMLKVMTPKYGIVAVPGTHFQHSLLVRQGLHQKIWAKLNVGGRFVEFLTLLNFVFDKITVAKSQFVKLFLWFFFQIVQIFYTCICIFWRWVCCTAV